MSPELSALHAKLLRANQVARDAAKEAEQAREAYEFAQQQEAGCHVIGFTVDFCKTCGLEVMDPQFDDCPHRPAPSEIQNRNLPICATADPTKGNDA